MLRQLYLLQKLALVQSFKKVPKGIRSKVSALNDLRNGIAHTFHIRPLPKGKRTYKGIDVFTPKGFESFRDDMWEVRTFFNPFLVALFQASDDGGTASNQAMNPTAAGARP